MTPLRDRDDLLGTLGMLLLWALWTCLLPRAHGETLLLHCSSRRPHQRQTRREVCVRGLLRFYDFARLYEAPQAPADQHATAIGGMIDLQAHPFDSPRLHAHVAFWDAQGIPAFENHEDDDTRFDPTLYGLSPVHALAVASVGWQKGPWSLSLGDRLLETPWMGPSDSRMIPASYQGVTVGFTRPGWHLLILRVTRWKSRTSDTYSATTLYNTAGTSGIEGGSPVAAVGARTTPGTFALGLGGSGSAIDPSIWYYVFDEYAHLLYATVAVPPGHSPLAPGWRLQALREWSQGNTLLATPVDSWAWGGEVLVPTGLAHLGVVLAFDRIVPRSGAFASGGIVSPYSAGYATDPLYTTSMIAGLVEKGPGSAVKIGIAERRLEPTLRMTLSWARYFTAPRATDTSETDLDLTWWPRGVGQGLSLRNRLGILTGLAPPSPYGTFLYERFMLAYAF